MVKQSYVCYNTFAFKRSYAKRIFRLFWSLWRAVDRPLWPACLTIQRLVYMNVSYHFTRIYVLHSFNTGWCDRIHMLHHVFFVYLSFFNIIYNIYSDNNRHKNIQHLVQSFGSYYTIIFSDSFLLHW